MGRLKVDSGAYLHRWWWGWMCYDDIEIRMNIAEVEDTSRSDEVQDVACNSSSPLL